MVVVKNDSCVDEDNKFLSSQIDKLNTSEAGATCLQVMNTSVEVRAYRRRWLQLILLFVLNISTGIHWHQFTAITNIIRRYYKVSSLAVESTFLMFSVVYMILMLPASYLMNRVGLRWTILITTLLTSVGCWIKVFSASPDRFLVAFIGQLVIAAAQILGIAAPGRMAAYWFGPEQVGFAATTSTLGLPMGSLVTFVIASSVMRNHERIEDIGHDLSMVFLALAIGSTIITLALFCLFQDQPDMPPSTARALVLQTTVDAKLFWPQIRKMLSNRDFIIFLNSYGIIVGCLGTLGTFLNPFYIAHFKNDEKTVGILGILFNVAGTIGAVICSVILDKTKAFRALPIIISGLTVVGSILFATSMLTKMKWMAVANSLFWGPAFVGYTSIGIELCVEMTYPMPEATATAFLMMSQHVYGILITLFTGRLIEAFGDVAGHASLIACLTFGCLITIFNRFEQRRQKAGMIVTRYDDYSNRIVCSN